MVIANLFSLRYCRKVTSMKQAVGSTGSGTSKQGAFLQDLKAVYSQQASDQSAKREKDSPARSGGLSFIEHLDAFSETLECETVNTPFLVALDHESRRVIVTRPRCDMWSCPTCAQHKRDRWAVRIYRGVLELMQSGYPTWSFVTVTSHGKLKNFEQTNYVMRDAWAKLSARMRRAYSNPHYVLVPEQHKNGRLHLHMIVSAEITTRWLKDNAPSCGFGYQCEAQLLQTPESASWYVTKYMTKDWFSHPFPKGFKRVRTSQGYPDLTPESPLQGSLPWRRVGSAQNVDRMLRTPFLASYRPIWMATGERIKPM